MLTKCMVIQNLMVLNQAFVQTLMHVFTGQQKTEHIRGGIEDNSKILFSFFKGGFEDN